MTPQRAARLREKIRSSRARLLVIDPPVAMVLMYLSFIATRNVSRISTNGRTILLDPDWFQKLDDSETDYILSHETMHIVFEDYKRPTFFKGDRYHHACDIIVSSVLRARGWRFDELPHIGALPTRTYYPGHEGNELSPLDAYREVPFDPSKLSKAERKRFQIDSDEYWGKVDLPKDAVTILSPGFDDSTEAPSNKIQQAKAKKHRASMNVALPGGDVEDSDSDNTYIPENELDSAIDRLLNMIEIIDADSPQQKTLLERIRKGVGSAQLEWRRLLNDFLQEELNDYSFTPPDRRFADSGFFLPDFNQSESLIKDVLFMVDGSGSVSDKLIADIYGELCAAIEQYDGKLQGKLSFFDTQVTSPEAFSSIHELLKIKPKGHGGTDYDCIFRYVTERYDGSPSCIVIFTDGLDDYPPEAAACGIPVLWIICGDAELPKWGKAAHIFIDTPHT